MKKLYTFVWNGKERTCIAKCELIVGRKYAGSCRNALEAVWDGEDFVYTRTKFYTSYEEKIKHPEDFYGYDVFIPTKLIEE